MRMSHIAEDGWWHVVASLVEGLRWPSRVCKVTQSSAKERLWWPFKNLGVHKSGVRVIQGKYCKTSSRVRVNGQYNEEFGVRVDVHQACLLSPLVFIVLLEALLHELGTGLHGSSSVLITCCSSPTTKRITYSGITRNSMVCSQCASTRRAVGKLSEGSTT